MVSTCFIRWLAVAGSAVALAAGASRATAAGSESVLYVHENPVMAEAFLVQPLAEGRARVASRWWSGEGTVSITGADRVVTLDPPVTYRRYGPGLCWGYEPYDVDMTVRQIVFRRTKGEADAGESQVIEVGTARGVNECAYGHVEEYGAENRPGHRMFHRADSRRAGSQDLVPGARLAGMTSYKSDPVTRRLTTPDIVTFGQGPKLHFERAGVEVLAQLTQDRWWMLQFSGFQRGYARFSVDGLRGGERWVRAEIRDQRIRSVFQTLMVKLQEGASFGPAAAVSGRWESDRSWYIDGRRMYLDLFEDGTGFRSYAKEARPLHWWVEGANLKVDLGPPAWFDPDSKVHYLYTYQPLARHGKYQWVMGQMEYFPNEGDSYLYSPFLSLLVDTGKPAQLPPVP